MPIYPTHSRSLKVELKQKHVLIKGVIKTCLSPLQVHLEGEWLFYNYLALLCMFLVTYTKTQLFFVVIARLPCILLPIWFFHLKGEWGFYNFSLNSLVVFTILIKFILKGSEYSIITWHFCVCFWSHTQRPSFSLLW